MTEKTDTFVHEVRSAMEDILRFWTGSMEDPRGGYFGRMTKDGEIDETAPKGVVLNTRILWALSAAYGAVRSNGHLLAATRAKDYIIENFSDHKFGGVYWSLETDNSRLDVRKEAYAQAFAIYSLCEYISATGDESPLNQALNLYAVLEKEMRDRQTGGYVDTLERDWKECPDSGFGSLKSLGVQIHVLEALVSLYELHRTPEVRESLVSLVNVFVDRIFDAETGHLGSKFDREWKPLCRYCSFGHELEASWILLRAAFAAGDIDLVNRTRPVVEALYNSGIAGMQTDGSVIRGVKPDGTVDTDRWWWVQAETVVACMYIWKYTGKEDAARKALRCWNYIKTHFVSDRGEWYRRLNAAGVPYAEDDLVAADKGPYHNTRMCKEVLTILK